MDGDVDDVYSFHPNNKRRPPPELRTSLAFVILGLGL